MANPSRNKIDVTRKPSHKALYNLAIWVKVLRPSQLARAPLCEECLKLGRVNDGSLTLGGDPAPRHRRSLIVDHIIPHRGDWSLFSDPENLQTLCKSHHDRVKQREEKRGYTEARGADGWPVDPHHPANHPSSS